MPPRRPVGVHRRVHVGHQAEPPGIMRDQRQQVLDGLDPGRPRAVLGEQQRRVHAFGRQEGVEPGRDRIAVRAEHVAPRGVLTEIDRPLHPGGRHGVQPGHVHVGVGDCHAVDHGRSPDLDQVEYAEAVLVPDVQRRSSGYGITSGGSSKMRVVRRPGAYGGQPGSPSAANAAHCERIRSPSATALAGGSGPNSSSGRSRSRRRTPAARRGHGRRRSRPPGPGS